MSLLDLSPATLDQRSVERVTVTVPVEALEETAAESLFAGIALGALGVAGLELLAETLHYIQLGAELRDAQRPMPVWQDEVQGEQRVLQANAPRAWTAPQPFMEVEILVPRQERVAVLDPSLAVHEPVLAAAFQAEAPRETWATRLEARREAQAQQMTPSQPLPRFQRPGLRMPTRLSPTLGR